jgi:hypothetical protein
MRKTNNTIGKQKVYVHLERPTTNPKTLGIIEGMKKVIDQLGLPINTA